jgi:hypothetical protein
MIIFLTCVERSINKAAGVSVSVSGCETVMIYFPSGGVIYNFIA